MAAEQSNADPIPPTVDPHLEIPTSVTTKPVPIPPTYLELPTILPSSSNPVLEYSSQPSSTLSIPSGIIPLASSQHHVVSTNQQSYSVTQLAAFANLSALSQSVNTPSLIAPAVVSSAMVLPSPMSTSLPDTPPPPYTSSDVAEEFSCSSPSQFLHSPKTVQSGTPFDERIPTPEKSKSSQSSNSLRTRVLNLRKSKVLELKQYYENMLQERFFLEGGGNMIDYHTWKKKPNILKEQYLKQHDLDSDVAVFEDLLSPRDPSNLREKIDTEDLLEPEPPLDIESISRQSTLKFQTGQTAFVPTPPNNTLFQSNTPVTCVASPSHSLTLTSPRPPLRMHTTLTSVADISHEDIVMRARHEADVMKAISELRKEGLWSSTRLPKVQEPSRIKTHWDYLLEEMHWLATDFANERRWKLNAAKKICRTVARHHHEREQQIQRTQREELVKLKKIASTLAKEVKHFWDSIQKIVEHKQHALLEEKRRKAMDMHLNFIVDQTQKYSNWLMQGLNPNSGTTPSDNSVTPAPSHQGDPDDVFIPVSDGGSDDDEETIDKEETIAEKEGMLNYQSEIQQLQMEGELSIDDLIASLPQELRDGLLQEQEESISKRKRARLENASGEPSKRMKKDDLSNDEDKADSVNDDDESVLTEQESFGEKGLESADDSVHQDKYNEEQISTNDSSDSNDIDDCDDQEQECEKLVDSKTGLEFLVSNKTLEEIQTQQGLTDVAAAAQQLQPTGITLSTTKVKTKIPFLLKHQLREYQYIGLDWLVTMHERRLNGILADEMGLGKTIQTIALLAHLACEKGNWGPHLIIVPTSVLLNWEFEFKKWCPGFKILTYFGSFKERKQKRVGWSKFNAFHVCVTSYNIAVQDHRAFKQKKWKYLILDEAQNIKNFKSLRWQTLLTFNSQHRLLLTGTPLQNNLMELWSLMHFLMPTVFSSHSDFKEWFSNPLTGMVEGSEEYNESIVARLHQILRPFLLRRLKSEVEKQLPQKFEHLILCKLSKRQRFLYEEYMSRAKTKETLSTGNYLSVINVLMQLRKVCNHPDLFEPRPVTLPFRMNGIVYSVASIILSVLSYNPFKHVSLGFFNLQLADYELSIDAFVAYRSRQLQAPRSFLTEFDLSEAEVSDVVQPQQSCPSWLVLHSSSQFDDSEFRAQRESLHRINSMRCRRQPVYGCDMNLAVRTRQFSTHYYSGPPLQSVWLWIGYLHCQFQFLLPHHHLTLSGTLPLQNILISYEERRSLLEDILKRFLITVLPVTAPPVSLHASHPHPSFVNDCNQMNYQLNLELSPLMAFLHPISTSFEFHFPETRLIQYDCGKLQTLDILMRNLRTEGHRVLVFTQMSRMLDVLEIFLTFHGYTYLRLDGATPVQKRQVLMDRFNKDSRIFCFILSTRSGGLGVNLTGADTVIFYDSDWNPTMDAQAQDRCHRIGQTRDVHIYRLVCDNTVEENILKKATQKRMLGNLAIESGSFTTDFFTKSTLNEILLSECPESNTLEDDISSKQLEELLLQAEEDRDVEAAKMAKAEQVAELAEFDDQYHAHSSAFPEHNGDNRSQILQEFAVLEEQLNGVERYAMKYIEAESFEKTEQQLREAEENIELAKKEWELSHLQQLREQEERMVQEEEEEQEAMSLTYDRPEMINKILIDEETGTEMPMWFPPTPPSDDCCDYYVDLALDMTYDTQSVMTPVALVASAVYSDEDYDVFGLYKVPSEAKPMKTLRKATSKHKRENTTLPQSLFWRRYTPDVLTTRIRKLSPQTKKVKTKAEQFMPLLEAQEGPDWLCTEDWILIKGLTSVLEFPLSLNATVPAQMPNWTVLGDLVSSLGKHKRSALQCKDHLVGVLIPREEQFHRITSHSLEEIDVRKQQKTSKESTLKKHKFRQEQRSFNQVVQDNGKELSKLFDHCFDWIMKTQEKNKQQIKKNTSDSSPRSCMHVELLHKEYDIHLGSVTSPSTLAQQRAERIQLEMPRSSQMHQLLVQGSGYGVQHLRQYGSNFAKPALSSESSKITAELVTTTTTSGSTVTTLSRPTSISSVAQLTQRLQASIASCSSESISLTSTQQPQLSTTATPVSVSSIPLLGKTSQLPTSTISTPSTTVPSVSSTISNAAAAAAAAAVAKTYHGVDISKGLFFGQRLTQQQILLLRQTALQQQQHLQQQHLQQKHQQQTNLQSTSQQSLAVPHVQIQRQAQSTLKTQGKTNSLVTQSSTTNVQLPAKIQIPGVEQLRPTIALQAQRVPNTFVRAAGLPSRSMQTEEVLALLRQQQALRLAMQSHTTAKLGTTQTGLNEAIAAAAVAAAVKQSPKPSVVAPTETVKVPPDQVSVVETSQVQVELVEHAKPPVSSNN